MKGLLRQTGVVLALGVTLAVNTLATTLPINGQNTGAISDTFEVYFKPAGYAFSIWGWIYLLLSVYAGLQLLPSRRDNLLFDRIGFWFIISCVFNAGWIFAWHYLMFPLTLVIMLALLATLVRIYILFDDAALTPADRWLVRMPFRVYLGWITVATLANATIVLADAGFTGGPEWAAVLIAAGLIVAVLVPVPRKDIAYLLVLAWAFRAIAVKFPAEPVITTSVNAALLLLAGMVVYVSVQMWRARAVSA
jgi:hypothetical protein